MMEMIIPLAALALGMGIVVPIALYQAWFLTILWHWYAPAAMGDLSMKTAIGLSLVISLLNMRPTGKDDAGWDERLAMAIIGPPVILLAGWLLLFCVS